MGIDHKIVLRKTKQNETNCSNKMNKAVGVFVDKAAYKVSQVKQLLNLYVFILIFVLFLFSYTIVITMNSAPTLKMDCEPPSYLKTASVR